MRLYQVPAGTVGRQELYFMAIGYIHPTTGSPRDGSRLNARNDSTLYLTSCRQYLYPGRHERRSVCKQIHAYFTSKPPYPHYYYASFSCCCVVNMQLRHHGLNINLQEKLTFHPILHSRSMHSKLHICN